VKVCSTLPWVWIQVQLHGPHFPTEQQFCCFLWTLGSLGYPYLPNSEPRLDQNHPLGWAMDWAPNENIFALLGMHNCYSSFPHQGLNLDWAPTQNIFNLLGLHNCCFSFPQQGSNFVVAWKTTKGRLVTKKRQAELLQHPIQQYKDKFSNIRVLL